MSTVGTLMRFPGIVRLSISSGTTILRGQLVTVDATAHTARLANVVGDRIYGIAISDSDPDILVVDIAIKGGYTVPVTPKSGDVFLIGSVAYQDQTTFSQVTITVTASKVVGWIVDPQPSATGALELAFFFDLEA